MFIITGTLDELEQLQTEVSPLTDSQLVALYRRSGTQVGSDSELQAEELIGSMSGALPAAMELVRRGKGELINDKERR